MQKVDFKKKKFSIELFELPMLYSPSTQVSTESVSYAHRRADKETQCALLHSALQVSRETTRGGKKSRHVQSILGKNVKRQKPLSIRRTCDGRLRFYIIL